MMNEYVKLSAECKRKAVERSQGLTENEPGIFMILIPFRQSLFCKNNQGV
jgi:hypothetical protein